MLGKWFIHSCLGFMVLLHGALVRGDVTTDGTLGDKVHYNDSNIIVGEFLGTIKGGNLFHSFQVFDINSGQSVTFTGSDFIKNLIVRVTGDHASRIDDRLSSRLKNADFFLMNPSGVVIGQGASINVPAGFHVSTADSIKLADGGVFSAAQPGVSVLTSGTPESFGFLGGHQVALRIDGAFLKLVPGQKGSFTGGNLVIENGALIKSSGGEIRLRAVGDGKADVGIHDSAGTDLQNAQYNGDLRIDNSSVTVDGDGGGLIVAQAGNLTINHGDLTAQNIGSTDSSEHQGIRIGATGALTVIANGQIKTGALGAGQGGQIKVSTGSLHIGGQGSGILSDAGCPDGFCGSGGNAGNITVNAQDAIKISDSGVIESSTYSQGNAGKLRISADNITIDGREQQQVGFANTGIFSDSCPNRAPTCSADAGNAANVTIHARDTLSVRNDASLSSATYSNGHGGKITIYADKLLSVSNGGFINTSTYAAGDAGNVTVQAANVSVDGRGVVNDPATITSDSFSEHCSTIAGCDGKAGDIRLNVRDTLRIVDGGKISTSTLTDGNAGRISVNADNATIDGRGNWAGIYSDSGCTDNTCGGRGNAGEIKVNVRKNLKLVNGGVISTDTFRQGKAGTINVNADNLVIEGRGKTETGLFSRARENSSGQTGSINVKAARLSVSDQGQMSIESDATVSENAAGHLEKTTVTIHTDDLELSNGGTINASSNGNVAASGITINADNLTMQDAAIKTAALRADGGPISIKGSIARLTDSRITTSVSANGNGGDINISDKALILNGGFIQANAAGKDRAGGDVRIAVDTLLASHGQLQVGGDEPSVFQRGFNVIQAVSPDGVSGTINSTAPELNINGAMLNLKSDFLQSPDLNSNPCTIGEGSSLVQAGYGGLPPGQDDGVYVPDHAELRTDDRSGVVSGDGNDAVGCGRIRGP